MSFMNIFLQSRFHDKKTYRLFPYISYLFLDLVKKILLRLKGRKNKFYILFHKMPKSQKLIAQNNFIFIASIAKINSARTIYQLLKFIFQTMFST